MCHVGSLDNRIQREGEFLSNVLTGWNFGDGHCLDERLIAGWQERCQYEPGDVVAVFTESQSDVQQDHAVPRDRCCAGHVEKGWYHNDDAYNTQPWLPDGPIPHTVTWRMPGYEPQGVPHPGDARRELSVDHDGTWLIPRAASWRRAAIGRPPATRRRPARAWDDASDHHVTSAIVVGSGPNGLAAAARLARAGLDVTVLEASDTIGGGTRSSEMIVPGLVHDHCSAFHPIAAASPYLSTLPARRARAAVVAADHRLRTPARRRFGRRAQPVDRPHRRCAR
jgi:hypothetical protein